MEFDFEPVLAGVNLEVAAGGVTVLLGPSGSGKTTLIKHVLGLLTPDEGAVVIGDREVAECSSLELRELRRNLSALHGGATVYEGSILASLTLRDNLLTRLHERHANPSVAAGGVATAGSNNPYVRLWTANDRPVMELPELSRRAQDWLDRFDLAEVADLYPHEASAGQRRRTAVASALAVDAPLYVLDDLDGALDGSHRRVVIDSLLETHRRTGATILLTTHDLDLAGAVADDIAVLAGGRVVFQGNPADALRNAERWYHAGTALTRTS
jgi:phospholipid/cholesterol/gamma-HCH transport system ATP-binding protein